MIGSKELNLRFISLSMQDGSTAAHRAATSAAEAMAMTKPAEYNLQGIKDRLKSRYGSDIK